MIFLQHLDSAIQIYYPVFSEQGMLGGHTHRDILAAQKALSLAQRQNLFLQKIPLVAKVIFGTIQTTIQHFYTHTFVYINITCVSKGLRRLEFEQKTARYGRKLDFLTDYDVARHSLKKINAERKEERMTLRRAIWPFYDKRSDLIRTATCLRKKLADLKEAQKEADKVFRKMNKIYSSLSNIEHVPVSLQSFSPHQAIEKCKHFRSFVSESQQNIADWNRVKNHWGKEINGLNELLKPKLEKYYRNKKKVDLTLPRSLSDIQIYPLLILQCGDAQILFSPNSYRIKVNLMTSPLTLAYDHLAKESNSDEVKQLVEKMAEGLKINPEDLLAEVETKGWQPFIETRIIPNSKVDYQSVDALARLHEKQELPLVQNIQQSDVQDTVSLDSFDNPVTLTCGHTFSWNSLKEQKLCPHCRKEIDEGGVLPNEFLNQLSSIYKQKKWRAKLQKLAYHVHVESEKLNDLYYQVDQIDFFRSQAHPEQSHLSEFDTNLSIMERTIYSLIQRVQELSNSNEEKTLGQLMRKFQQELDEIEEKIEQANASIHLLTMEAESIELIGDSRLMTMAHALADAYQKRDLVAVIPMDIAKKEYIEKVSNKLAIAKKDLAAAEYVYFNFPKLIKNAEAIFKLSEKVFKPPAYPVIVFPVSKDSELDSLS